MTGRRTSGWLGAAMLAGAIVAGASPAGAQDGHGFLFSAPRATMTLRGGMSNAAARGDLFDFATDTLTLDRKDFAGLALGADLTFTTAYPRLGVVVGAGYASASAPSEFVNWVDNNDQPIAQTTKFVRVPLTVGLRTYLVPPGETVGSLAWIPARVAPYLGAGVGATWYRFRQQGSFVDFATSDVFDDTFQTSGWGPTAYGAAGLDYSIGPRVALTGDVRYTYAKAGVGQDFSGFDRIDLSGLATTVGITFRF